MGSTPKHAFNSPTSAVWKPVEASGSEWKPAHCLVHTVNNTAAAAAAIMGKSNVNIKLQNKVVFYTEETPSLFCCWSRFCSAK